MSQLETSSPPTCVPAYDAKSKSPEVPPAGAPAAPAPHQIGDSHPAAGVPVTRGPGDVWHSEAYLISWLVKTHGWRVIEPGLIRRMDGLERSVTLPVNRRAGLEQLKQLRGAA